MKRIMLGITLIALVLSAVTSGLEDQYKVTGFKVIVADQGDTFWGLCKRVNYDLLKSGDVGECVHHLAQANKEIKSLQVGDSVKVPVLVLND